MKRRHFGHPTSQIRGQVLVPLIKALQAELGEERANGLVRRAQRHDIHVRDLRPRRRSELGFLLVCAADFATAQGFDPDIELTRTQTIMQGASHCDFRYRRSGKTD